MMFDDRDTLADKLNKYRVFPRVFFFLYSLMSMQAFYWYTGLELQTQTTQNASFAGAIIAAWFTWFAFYVNSGKK